MKGLVATLMLAGILSDQSLHGNHCFIDRFLIDCVINCVICHSRELERELKSAQRHVY